MMRGHIDRRTPEGDARVAELARMTPEERAEVTRANLAALVADIGVLLETDPLEVEHVSPAVPSASAHVTEAGALHLYGR
jgi:hypothetical protein